MKKRRFLTIALAAMLSMHTMTIYAEEVDVSQTEDSIEEEETVETVDQVDESVEEVSPETTSYAEEPAEETSIEETENDVSQTEDSIEEEVTVGTEDQVDEPPVEEEVSPETTSYAEELVEETSIEESENELSQPEDSVEVEETSIEESVKELPQTTEETIEESVAHTEELTNVEESKEVSNENTNSYSKHKVSVVTEKLDDQEMPLEGAVLQILDLEGNVLDEWISDGTEHVTMLPEGDYILHEKEAPNGYKSSEDVNFSVKVVINEINAGVVHDDSHDVCWHYLGVPLYYVESNGEKEEVYCINQNWDEPNDINYDGKVLDVDNIKALAPDSDPTMTNVELYNKVLDIVYHRSKVSEKFPELTETEIRFITEYALKNYTSTMVNDGTMFRQFRYDPTDKKGFVIDAENGNAIGQLAKHWWYYHSRTTIPAIYAELYYYLVSEEDSHPEDMHLYIYSTGNLTEEGELYQNLLGVKWFDPYDENYKVHLTKINEKKPETPPEEPKPEEPEKPEKPEKPQNPEEPKKPHEPEKPEAKVSPNTGDQSNMQYYLFVYMISITGIAVSVLARKKFD